MNAGDTSRRDAARAQQRARRWYVALWLGLIAGCATLPDVHVLRAQEDTNVQAPVVGPRGPLSKEQSDAVIAKLQAAGSRSLLDHHLQLMQAVNPAPLVLGNATRLLIDGPAAHTAMFASIARARDHVNMQTYIFEDDEVGHKLAELLLKKRSEGIQVNLMYDSIGSMRTPPAFFDRLRAGGIAVCAFNPVNPLKGKTVALNHRDHRKLLVADGIVAYAGGINISAVYSSSSFADSAKPAAEDGWRDTQIEVRGPAVAEFQKLFFQSWRSQRCAPLASRKYMPPLEAAGDRILRVIGSGPNDTTNMIYVEMLSAIGNARRTIHVTMAYFVPNPELIAALVDRARSGVEVILILPGVSDFWAVFHAGRSHYQTLLDAGVRIYERKDALLHAKTAVIDGVWSTVGSANMDWRSFLHNDELNVVVLGAGFGQEMARMFRTDLEASTPIDPQAWARRGPSLRLREMFARMWEYWL
jgi:cardiolipin synthase